jgi:dTMP kinase
LEIAMAYSVVLEAIEFGGKTTQSALVASSFEPIMPVLRVREPGGTPLGEEVRNILKNDAFHGMHPYTNLLLFSAARNELLETKVAEFNRENELGIIIADRGWPSTFVHQAMDGVRFDDILAVQDKFVRTYPNLIVFIDISPEEAYRRSQQQQEGRQTDWRDRKTVEQLTDERNRYLTVLSNYASRLEVVDGNKPVVDVTREIRQIIIRRMLSETTREMHRELLMRELQRDEGSIRNSNPERR